MAIASAATHARLEDALTALTIQNLTTASAARKRERTGKSHGVGSGYINSQKARKARKAEVIAATDALLVELGLLTKGQS